MAHSPATEMVVDTSKFLHFAASSGDVQNIRESPEDLIDVTMVQKYLTKLEEDGIECAGQLTKLSRIQTASQFASFHFKWDRRDDFSVCQREAISRFSTWKKTLTKERTGIQKRKRPITSRNLPSGSYMDVLTLNELRGFVEKGLSDTDISASVFNRCMAYLAMYLCAAQVCSRRNDSERVWRASQERK